MKPKTKGPAKKREQKKHIHLVIPEKPVAATQSTTEPATAQPSSAQGEPTSAQTPKADYAAIAAQIADALGETKRWPRKQIKHIVWALGSKQTQALARKAREIEDAGGMLALNGQHRRTVGGIFFYLCYTEGKPRPGKVLTRPMWKPRPRVVAPVPDEGRSDIIVDK